MTESAHMSPYYFSFSKNGTWLFLQRNQQLLCSPLSLTKPANILRSPSMVQSFLLKNNQKSLVTHDTMYTFTPHCQIQAAKVRACNNLLKALAGTSWGQQKETLILTYQALGRSVIDHAAPVWAPVINRNNFKLHTMRHSALQPAAIKCHTQIIYMWRQSCYSSNTIQNFSPSNTGFLATNHIIRVIISPLCLPQRETWRAGWWSLTARLCLSQMKASQILTLTETVYYVLSTVKQL